MKHNIPIGTLVEVCCPEENMNGIRLFITAHRNDCDGTPLYSLGLKGEEELSRMYHGIDEKSLMVLW